MNHHKCLIGAKELAEILDISKQNLNHRMKTGQTWYGTDIPTATYKIGAGRIWTYEQIKARIEKEKSRYGDWGGARDRFKDVTNRIIKTQQESL